MNNLTLGKAAKFAFFNGVDSLENKAANRVDDEYNDDVDIDDDVEFKGAYWIIQRF